MQLLFSFPVPTHFKFPHIKQKLMERKNASPNYIASSQNKTYITLLHQKCFFITQVNTYIFILIFNSNIHFFLYYLNSISSCIYNIIRIRQDAAPI